MRHKHEATPHVLINAFLAPVRVVSITVGDTTYIAPASELQGMLAAIVDDGSEPGLTYRIEFKSLARPDFDTLGSEYRFTTPSRTAPAASGRSVRSQNSVRVACLSADGSTYVVEVDDLATALVEVADDGDEDSACEYTVTFKNMPRVKFKKLGEFDGF